MTLYLCHIHIYFDLILLFEPERIKMDNSIITEIVLLISWQVMNIFQMNLPY